MKITLISPSLHHLMWLYHGRTTRRKIKNSHDIYGLLRFAFDGSRGIKIDSGGGTDIDEFSIVRGDLHVNDLTFWPTLKEQLLKHLQYLALYDNEIEELKQNLSSDVYRGVTNLITDWD